ncbi:ABC transporter substrate-binding protein [Undibacterium arcticum]|uniref:ABC transporter substrate-binding protein n=1 Tax=Undibacterium arcticum TaxID=1762892 RepID=UPI003618AFDE
MKLLSFCAKVMAGVVCGLILHGAAIAKADSNKILHLSFEAADDGFDLTRTNSLYTNWLAEGVFESLLAYDYLARPAKLIPGVAEAMPEISEDGKTYVFHIKKGVYFTPDPAFKGQRRELIANDFAYAIKRHLDPKNHSTQAEAFTGKIVGLDELAAEAQKTGHFDYDKLIAGLETPDRHTLRIRLRAPNTTLVYHLANAKAAAVAREVVEMYGDDIGQHPVGTGPYMLRQYVPRSKIVLVANPDYRGFVWDFTSSGDKWDEKIIHDMRGKQMPQVGRVEINIIEEEQSRWLAFDSGQLDLEQLSDSASPKVLDGDKLKPAYSAKGITLYRYAEPGVTRTFQFQGPGGRRLQQGKNCVAPRHRNVVQPQRGNRAGALRSGHQGAIVRSSWRGRLRSELSDQRRL